MVHGWVWSSGYRVTASASRSPTPAWRRVIAVRLLPVRYSAGLPGAARAAVAGVLRGLGTRTDVFQLSDDRGCSHALCGEEQLPKPRDRTCSALYTRRMGKGAVSAELTARQVRHYLATDPRCARKVRTGDSFGQLVAGNATVLHNLFGVTARPPSKPLPQEWYWWIRTSRCRSVTFAGPAPSASRPSAVQVVRSVAVAISRKSRSSFSRRPAGTARHVPIPGASVTGRWATSGRG
jgi:hypothetical protein